MKTWTALLLWHDPPPYSTATRQHYLVIDLETLTRRKPGARRMEEEFEKAERRLTSSLKRRGIAASQGIFVRKEFRLVRLPSKRAVA